MSTRRDLWDLGGRLGRRGISLVDALLALVNAKAATLQLNDLGVVKEALFRHHGYPDLGSGRCQFGPGCRDNHGPARNRIKASGARYRPGLADTGVSRARAFSFMDMSAWR